MTITTWGGVRVCDACGVKQMFGQTTDLSGWLMITEMSAVGQNRKQSFDVCAKCVEDLGMSPIVERLLGNRPPGT